MNAFAEIVIWRLHSPLESSVHHVEYRLAYVVRSHCVLRYDNERGKGDHRRFGERERGYSFSTPDEMMADCYADIARWNDENGGT